jgi:hypothetical protein
MSRFGSPLRPSEAAEQTALTIGHLARLRRSGVLKEGIHYYWLSPRHYRYLSDSLRHFFLHRAEPEVHEKWIRQRL